MVLSLEWLNSVLFFHLPIIENCEINQLDIQSSKKEYI